MGPRLILNGGEYRRTPEPGRPAVFVADQRASSDAHVARHAGLGVVTDWLDPLADDRARLAMVTLADGSLACAPCSMLRPAENVAARRILPTSTAPERRLA